MANCILTTSKEYQDLKTQSGIKESTLKAAISLFQEDNNTDKFPTVDEVKKILSDSTVEVNVRENEMTQNVNTSQSAIVEGIKKMQTKIQRFDRKEGIETLHGYSITTPTGTKEVLITPTKIAETDERRKNRGKVYKENPIWTKWMNEGTMVHNWIEEFVNNKISGNKSTPLYDKLSPSQQILYKNITSDIDTLIESLKKEYPNSSFMTEVKVYDPNFIYTDENNKVHKGVAGSIDLLIIHPDGTASIYDWKTRNKSKEFDRWKYANYSMQIAIYKQILMRGNAAMDVPKVRGIKKSRLIPIELQRNKLSGEISQIKYMGEVPVAGEQGTNEKLNSRIEAMYTRFHRMIKAKAPTEPVARKLYYDKIDNLKDMLITLQLKKSYNSVLEQAEDDLDSVTSTINKEDITAEELQEALEIVDMYTDILDYADYKAMTPEVHELFKTVSSKANEFSKIIVDKQVKLQQENADKYGITNLLKVQKGTGWVGKTFNSISQVNHPMIAYLHEMVKESLAKTEQESNEFRETVTKEITALSKWANAHGISLQKAYDLIINKEKGSLINKFKKDYWEQEKIAIENNDTKWLEANKVLDKDKADKRIAAYIEEKNKIRTTRNKARIDKEIEDFRTTIYNLGTSFYAKMRKDVESKWYSEEYSNLIKPENKELLKFYEFFTSSTEKFAHLLPNFGYRGNFIPNVHTTIVEEISRASETSGTGLVSAIKRVIEVNSNAKQDLGMIDQNTGTQGGQIPVFFINNVDPKTKSYDLGKVLQMFGEMSYNFDNMSAIETNAVQTLSLLKSAKAYEISTISGKKVKNSITGNFKTTEEANKNWVEMYEDFLGYFLYGIKTKGANKFTEALDTINQFTATTMLGLSIMPAIAATTANIANTAIQGARNDFFSTSQWGKAVWMLSGGSAMSLEQRDIAYGFLELFQPHIDNRKFAKDRKLSSSIAVKGLTSDHLFIGLRAPDMFNQSAVALAMLQNSTFDENGNIILIKNAVKKPKGYYNLSKEERKVIDTELAEKRKNIKSVYEMGKIVDGKFTIEGHEDLTKLTDKAIMGFRQLVKQVNKNIIGNVDADDISGYRMIAYFRSLMLFRNWMPRAISERYGALRYNREMGQHEWGRYNTFYDHMKIQNFWSTILGKQKDEANRIRWNFAIGIEEAAKMEWVKAIAEDEDLIDTMTEEEFIELYKSNIMASYRGIAITFAVLTLMLGAGKYFDDDDKLTPGEAYTKKVFKRVYSELAMFINPVEALNILKSPSAAMSPLASAVKVITNSIGETTGFIMHDDEIMKKNKPLKYILALTPISGLQRSVMAFNKNIEDYIEK